MQTAHFLRTLPVSSSVIIWLVAFLSPTGYLLALLAMAKLKMPTPPAWVIVGIFFLIPLVALWICSTVAWHAQVKQGWRLSWLAATILGLLLQFGVLVIVITSVITVMISLP
jgi:hypothetical protein